MPCEGWLVYFQLGASNHATSTNLQVPTLRQRCERQNSPKVPRPLHCLPAPHSGQGIKCSDARCRRDGLGLHTGSLQLRLGSYLRPCGQLCGRQATRHRTGTSKPAAMSAPHASLCHERLIGR